MIPTAWKYQHKKIDTKLEVPTPCNNMTLHVAGQSGERQD